jgi:low temperature requirement protein LtrA
MMRRGRPWARWLARGGAPPGRTGQPDAAGRGGPSPPAQRVSTLELFFDLVFAFTLTQLSGVLALRFDALGVVQVLLIFGVLWWMYGAYAWLTNTRAPGQVAERLLLLTGMGGFLVVALAIPGAFGPDGLTLGLGYLVVVLVHGWMYFRVNRNIGLVAPFNVASALLVVGASFAGGPARYALWVAALAVQVLSPLVVHPRGRFEIQPGHFVERHGALIIITFGETVVAVGIALSGLRLTPALVTAALLGLALSAVLWWTYFGTGDDEAAQNSMRLAPAEERPVMALNGYFYAHIPILLGVVTLAAGLRYDVGHALHTAPEGRVFALAAGPALFLAGDVLFRRSLRIGPSRLRAAGALVVLATAAVGLVTAAAIQLTVLVALLALVLTLEQRVEAQ